MLRNDSEGTPGNGHRVFLGGWVVVVLLLAILLVNTTFCLYRIRATSEWLEDYQAYVFKRDAEWHAQWYPMLKDTTELVREIHKNNRIRAQAAAKAAAAAAARAAARAAAKAAAKADEASGGPGNAVP